MLRTYACSCLEAIPIHEDRPSSDMRVEPVPLDARLTNRQRITEMRRRIHSWLMRAGLLEAAVLVSLLMIAAAIWGFAAVADEVSEGDTKAFDESVLRALRRDDDPSEPIGPVWLKSVARDFTALGGVAVISVACLGSAGFLALQRKWHALTLVLVSIGGGALVSTLLKGWFERPRPSNVVHLTEVNSLSFPSGHSMLAAVTYLTLGSLLARTTADRRIKIYILTCAVVLTGIIGTTRVFLGVHYPTDVLAGWCAGISWALICSLVARSLQKRGAVEPEAPSASSQMPPGSPGTGGN
jgi:undecaprenyl-diphosphatase